jgi:hypothetical protein
MMLPFSILLEICFQLCTGRLWQVTDQCNLIAWAYEQGNYMLIDNGGEWAVCFYAFCTYEEAKGLEECNNIFEGIKILMRKKTAGEVIYPFLVAGKILPEYKSLFKAHAKAKGAKYCVWFKTKKERFFMVKL